MMMTDEEGQQDDGGAHASDVTIEIHGPSLTTSEHQQYHQPPAEQEHHQVVVSAPSVHVKQHHEKPAKSHRRPKMTEITIAGEKTSGEVPSAQHLDIVDRDPQRINQHLKVAFEDIFAEPHPTIFSFDFVWRISYQAFTVVKLWTYRIITLLLAIPVSVIWAIVFALVAFVQIWFLVPIYRLFLVIVVLCQKFLAAVTDSFINPLTISVGMCFSNFRVFVVNGDRPDRIHYNQHQTV